MDNLPFTQSVAKGYKGSRAYIFNQKLQTSQVTSLLHDAKLLQEDINEFMFILTSKEKNKILNAINNRVFNHNQDLKKE